MQFSLFRLLLATTVFAAVLGLAQLLHLGMAGSVMTATGLAGIVLLRGNKGLRMSDRVAGFSPRRVAWATATLSLLLVPVHFFVSCGASGGIFFSDHVLLVITGALTFADRSRKNSTPFALAILGFIGHALCIH